MLHPERRRIQFYITREQNIALLITSFQFLSLPLAEASQWRQSKQRHHCPVPMAKTTVAQVRGGTWTLRMWVGGCWGCWWLGPMGYWSENLQCHIPIPSPFCWRFTTPGRTMSRRAAPCRGWEGGEMTCCSPLNRLNPPPPPPPPPPTSLPTQWDRDAIHQVQPRQNKWM